jgi:dTMP kinase
VTTALEQLKKIYRTPETPGSTFISFEGVEGSGKTTQIELVRSFLEQKGMRVLSLREPGGTAFGEKLREAILQHKYSLHPLAECHLFLASRAQLLREKILPFLLVPNSVVILDRYIDSTLAYQGKGRGLGYQTVLELHQHDPLNLLPHRTYFLDISLELSHERQNKRGNEKDYFESEKNDFHQKLIDSYRELSTLFPERILKVDASVSPDEITQTLKADLANFLHES